MLPMATLTLSLLGPFAAFLDERPLTKFTTNRVQALLIYLGVEAVTTPVRRDTLMGILWPDLPQESAQTNLRQTLYRLRKTIPELTQRDGENSVPFLLADRQTVQINPNGRFHLDVHQFTDLLKSDESHWPEAITLYRDNFLTDFYLSDSAPFEEWAAAQRSTLLRQALDALDTLTARGLEAGELDTAETYARCQLELDNLRESAHRQLMEILVRNGRRRAALTHYETCRQLLRDELDIEPTLETQKLYEAIRAGQFDGVVTPTSVADLAPPLKAKKNHNLPRQTTTFFGRKDELQTLNEFMANPEARLVTVVGPGGMGKTRLALETARQQLAAFDHGVWFASLAKLSSPDEIVLATAQALHFSFYEGSPPRQQLLDYLRNKSLLLVMDNYEHLLDGTDLVTDVLQTAPQVKVLATSREPLRLVEEQLFPLSGLAFSREDVVEGDAAVQLFLERARHLRPDLTLKADDVAHVTTICQQVEGMPLGLELAAAWADTLSLAEIAAELQGSLDLLESDMRNIADRHRSLRVVFEASWDRLLPNEQQLFAQLSVFRGGFTRTAAKAICAPDVSRPAFHRLLAALTRKSFLKHGMENGRYDIHELMRQFGAEKLAQSPDQKEAVKDRHSSYYCAFLQKQEAKLNGPQQKETVAEIEIEHENARSSWEWAVERERIDWLDQALDGLCRYYEWQWLNQDLESICRLASEKLMLSASGEGLLVLARILAWQGRFLSDDSDRMLLQQSLALLDKPESREYDTRTERAFALWRMGLVTKDIKEQMRLLNQSLSLYRELGDRRFC
jgi:predicted ATPase